MEGNPYEGADVDPVGELGGNEIVEVLVEASDVGDDPSRERYDLGQAPTAARKSSSRLRCSQVKSARFRPKWPYAAVWR